MVTSTEGEATLLARYTEALDGLVERVNDTEDREELLETLVETVSETFFAHGGRRLDFRR